MKTFQYCPNCKSSDLKFEEEKKYFCTNCGFVYYQNIAGATAVILRHNDSILLLRRNREPSIYKLDFAGGFIDPYESAENAATREVQEELNLEIQPNLLQYLASYPNTYIYKEFKYFTIDLYFLYDIEQLDFIIEPSEVKEALWIPINELKVEELAFESHKKFWRNHKEKLQLGF